MSEHDKMADVRAFWDSRAGLGQWAGSRDVIAKELEIEAIAKFVREGMSILDVGCGNGITALELAKRFDVRMRGVDYSTEMIAQAKTLAASVQTRGTVEFDVMDVLGIANEGKLYDLIYTERVLINLQDWPAQQKAIADIMSLLRPGGRYVMCENSQDGLNRLNVLRGHVGLSPVVPPWHNRYMNDAEIATVAIPGVTLTECVDYSSTYYFLSRVVNAALAVQEGREPSYDSPVNLLALKLPSSGNCGQGRLWVWRRDG